MEEQAASFRFPGQGVGIDEGKAVAAQQLATPGLHAWQDGHAAADQPIGVTPLPPPQACAAQLGGVDEHAAPHAGTAAGVGSEPSGDKGAGGGNSKGSSSGGRMVPDTGSGPRVSEVLAGTAAVQQLLPDSQRGSNSPGKRKGGLQHRPLCSEGPPAAPDQAPCAELSSQGRHSAAGRRARSGAADGGHAQDGGSQPATQPSQLRPHEVFPLSGCSGGGAPGSPQAGAEPVQAPSNQPEGGAGTQAGDAREQWRCAVSALCGIVAQQLGAAGGSTPAAQALPDGAAQEAQSGAEAPLLATRPEGAPGDEPPSNVWFTARSPGRAGASQPCSSQPSQQQGCTLQEEVSLSMAGDQPATAAPQAPVLLQRQQGGDEVHASAVGGSAQPGQAVAGTRGKRPLWPDCLQVRPQLWNAWARLRCRVLMAAPGAASGGA